MVGRMRAGIRETCSGADAVFMFKGAEEPRQGRSQSVRSGGEA